jgi:rubrerythrin
MPRSRFDSLVQVLLATSLLGAACGGGGATGGGGLLGGGGAPIENRGPALAGLDTDMAYVSIERLVQRYGQGDDPERVAAAASRAEGDDKAALAWLDAGHTLAGPGVWVDGAGQVTEALPEEFTIPPLASRPAFAAAMAAIEAEGKNLRDVVSEALRPGVDYLDLETAERDDAFARAGDDAVLLRALIHLGFARRGVARGEPRVVGRVWHARGGAVVMIGIEEECSPQVMAYWIAGDREFEYLAREGFYDESADRCQVVEGRLTDGLATSDAADYLERAIAHEALSARSFERLAAELTAFGAPAALVARTRAAAEDERRHAEQMAALAGAPPPGDRERTLSRRDLTEVARENAIEGCVHEAFAAVLVSAQARAVAGTAAGQVLADIAADERRHAELAWDVAAWLEARCDASARAEIERARWRACAELPRAVTASRGAGAPEFGMPDAATRALLASRFAAALPAWAEAA